VIGAFVYLQAFVCLGLCHRVLFFFRGSLKLGALTHILGSICFDILPLLILLFVFVLAFCASSYILLIHELGEEAYPEWHNFFDALTVMLNIGLYTYYNSAVYSPERRVLVVIYQLYMILVQVILLNMLIAIMGESHHRVSEQSELVALSGRAKLILEYETDEMARITKRSKRWFDVVRRLKAHDDGMDRMQRVCPKWLHVLRPAEHQRGEEGVGAEELKQLKELRRQMSAMGESLGARQQKVLDAVSKRDVQEERQRMMQAMRVELSQMREDIAGDIKAAVAKQLS